MSASDALARKQVAAGCLFTDDTRRILLVKPTYKSLWEIPGGAVEAGESPHAAARREVQEELGIARVPGRLLAVDFRSDPATQQDAIRFVFDGGVLSPTELAAITLPESELTEWRLVSADELDGLVTMGMARRLRASLGSPGGIYLENGQVPARDESEWS